MTTPEAALSGLKGRHPEWTPWLEVVGEVLRETGGSPWDAAVPAASPIGPKRPLLCGATVSLTARPIRRLLDRVIRAASRSGSPKMSSLEGALHGDLDVVEAFAASLRQDNGRIAALAAASGVDAEALQAVVALLPVPFLQACNRRLSSAVPASWTEGYCPVCASWPAFVEVRGIERSRYYRCGRCGGEWHASVLHCPYCSTNDHGQLTTFVPQSGSTHAVVEACRRCLGYVKTFTKLQGCPPAAVMLEDLASVELDVAALEQGCTRPTGGGYPVDAVVEANGASRHWFRRRS